VNLPKENEALAQCQPLCAEERHKILTQFSGPQVDCLPHRLVHELIAERARRHPNTIAIVCGDREMTYAELSRRAHSLACTLRRRHSVGHESLVCILMERSFEMVIAMLGVMEAGAAYVPIDPQCPISRISFILQDCQAAVLLTNVKRDLSSLAARTVIDLGCVEDCLQDDEAWPLVSSRDSLIYCLYTSGSSGEPKGVLVEHGGVLNVLHWVQEYFQINAEDRVLQKTTYTFDVSVTELFVPLMSGARLVLLPRGAERFPALIRDVIAEQGVTVVQFVPSVLASYLASLDGDPLPGVKKCICVGESLRPALRTAFYSAVSSQCWLYNFYGPTEASIYATACVLEPGDHPVTIGRPIPNTRIRILDEEGQLCPIGVPGELCIAGIAVARGYLNRPEQSRKKFVADPVVPTERMYRTGDLALWLENGELEFLGRRDYQVKIRGHRIELEEVECALSRVPGIEQTAVIAAESNGQSELVAYWVGDHRATPASLREMLGKMLPAYMLPGRFMRLEAFPLTVSGKVLRSALPPPDLQSDSEACPAGDILGQNLCSIFEEILGLRRVGLNGRFLDLGGDSLKAIRVMLLARRKLEQDIDIDWLLRNSSIEELKARLQGQKICRLAEIEPALHADWYPLSSGQRSLWLLEQAGVPHAAYSISGLYALRGALDANALRRSADLLLSRHESLRTAIQELDGVPVQRVVHQAALEWHFAKIEASSAIDEKICAFVNLRFDLSTGRLLRILLIEQSASLHILAVSMHHIASDGWSLTVLIDELLSTYTAVVDGKQTVGLIPRLQYKDYSTWQHSLLERDFFHDSRNYWMCKLGGAIERLELPADHPRPLMSTFRGAVARRTIPAGTLETLNALCRAERTTLCAALCTVLRVLFFRYTGQEDFVLGTSALGRSVPELRDQIGYYVNTLALRDRVLPAMRFREALREVQNTLLDAVKHRDYPFDCVVQDISVNTTTNRNPLFDVMLLIDSGWGDPNIKVQNLEVLHLDEPKDHSKLDLTLFFKETSEGLKVAAEYSTAIFDVERIDRMLAHFDALLTHALANPDLKVQELSLLSADERQCLVSDFNRTETGYAQDKTVTQLFEQQAERTPGRVATIQGDRQLKFAELNAKANALAWNLREEHGVGPEMLVAIHMNRSLEMMIAILGVLKAGGAYLPINPHDPTERIDFVLADSGSNLVLTHGMDGMKLNGNGRTILDMSSPGLFAGREDNPPSVARPCNLIYCIYTSGSTGKPKGALIEHTAVVNRLEWMIASLGLSEADVILQKTSIAFDVSVWELFLPGIIGARQVLLESGAESDPCTIRSAIRRHNVSTVHFVPSMLSHYLASSEDGLAGVKHCICSGEELGQDLVRRFFASVHDRSTQLYNFYGPTEATVDVSFQRIENDSAPISIGRPSANNSLYILDSTGSPCPVGIPGEMCIGGVQVGRGYLNRPELTEERFVPNPFRPGERMYRTGDLAMWSPNGEVRYLGRRDEQVKVRGFRIELGEIEQTLCSHPGITKAVVVPQRDETNATFLSAYVVGPSCPLPQQLREYLAARLPQYMVPSYYVEVDAIPITRTGKVDRKALAALELAAGSGQAYVAPRTQLEEEIVRIWQTLLPVSRIGIHDDFFAAGGNSLSALQLSSRINHRFGIAIRIASIFQHRTPAQLARLVAESSGVSCGPALVLRPRPRSTQHVLSFAQERIWFLHMLHPESAAYNMPALVKFGGQLELDALVQGLQLLVARHEILRLTFSNTSEGPFQSPQTDLAFSVEIRDFTRLSEQEARENVRQAVRADSLRPFRLEKEPPFRAVVFRLSPTEHYLFFVLHHIAGDGWSQRLILRELCALYRQNTALPEPELPPLALQYIDYAEAVRDPEYQKIIDGDLRYWADRLANCPSLAMPCDPYRHGNAQNKGREHLTVPPGGVRKLNQLARNAEVTLFEIVMCNLTLLLSRLSDQQDVAVGFPIANRQSVELENMVGMFLNTLVLRTDLSGRLTFRELLQRTSTGIREAFDHQAAPFELVVEQLNPVRDLNRTPVFSVLLNFMAPVKEEIAIDDVSIELEDVFEYEAKFPLSFYVEQGDQGLHLELIYKPDLFSAPQAQMMLRQLRHLLEQATEKPDRLCAEYSLIPPEDGSLFPSLDQLLLSPQYPPVTELIAQSTASFLEYTAISQGPCSITYRRLDERSEEIARCLTGQGCGPDTVIVVAGCRGIGFIVSLLAVWKSAAIIFPLDPSLPEARRVRLLTIGKPKLLIQIEDGMKNAVEAAATGLPVMRVDSRSGRLLTPSTGALVKRQPSLVSAQSPAYLFFTSGTTGSPRAVLGRHNGLSHFLIWQSQRFGITERDRCAQLTSLSFDVMLRDTFLVLISGGTVVVPEQSDELDGRKIFGWLEKERITVLHTVPTLLRSWLIDAPHSSSLPSLRWTFLAGEPLKASLVESFRAKYPDGGEIVNLYGPTETTLAKFAYVVPPGPLPAVLPVGFPLPCCQGFVMRDEVPCGVGEAGEIVIRTPFCTLGYLNAPEANKAAFYRNPRSQDQEDLLYRTGDIGRFLPNGALEILGRKDQQIKVNGIRVEPAEIEDCLARHPWVRTCAVTGYRDSKDEMHLVAHVVAAREDQSLADHLRRYLSGLLPSSMVPGQFMFIDRIPTTPTGKPDRHALPKPRLSDGRPQASLNKPHNHVEHEIRELWRLVFDRQDISLDDNFFEVGGNSLKLLRLFALLEEHFPRKFRVAQLFTNPTIVMQAVLASPALPPNPAEVTEIEF
jgi:amino acid adenylation domain-containing protein